MASKARALELLSTSYSWRSSEQAEELLDAPAGLVEAHDALDVFGGERAVGAHQHPFRRILVGRVGVANLHSAGLDRLGLLELPGRLHDGAGDADPGRGGTLLAGVGAAADIAVQGPSGDHRILELDQLPEVPLVDLAPLGLRAGPLVALRGADQQAGLGAVPGLQLEELEVVCLAVADAEHARVRAQPAQFAGHLEPCQPPGALLALAGPLGRLVLGRAGPDF